MSEDFLSAIEDACLNASAPPQQLWLDGWLVRFCPGKAKRSRSVNAVANGRLPLGDKLALAAAVYREARLPMLVRVTPFSQPRHLDAELAARAWIRFDDSQVLVAGDLSVVARAHSLPGGCTMRRVDHSAFAQAVAALRESPVEQQAGHAQRLAASPVPYQGWLLERDGQVLACGQVARQADHAGLYDVFTAPSARGRGLAQTLCRALLRRAAEEGARIGYLQVDAKNAPAIAVYRKLGFVDGYGYHYRAVEPALA